MTDDVDREYELLVTMHAIADATGYRMRDRRAWAPCTVTPCNTPVANPTEENTQKPQYPQTET